MVKGVRRCSARRARRIRGFNPLRRLNIYMDYVSTVVKKTSVERNIIHRRKKSIKILVCSKKNLSVLIKNLMITNYQSIYKHLLL